MRGRFTKTGAAAAFGLLLALSFAHAAGVRAQGGASAGRSGVWRPQGTILSASREEHGGNIGEPSVIPNDARPRILAGRATVWKMWFGGGWTSAGVFYAESPDGISWTVRPGAVIAGRVRNRVFKVGSTYHAFATPVSGVGIDHLTSGDGVTWTLLAASVIPKGGSGFDANRVDSCDILIEGSTWYAFYDGLSAPSGEYSTGLAVSTDGGLTFTKQGRVIATSGRVKVRKVGSTYYAWGQYIPTGPLLPTDIYRWQAASPAGPWTVSAANAYPRTTADEGAGLSTGQAADCDIHEVNGRTYLFYTGTPDGGSPEGRSHIKLATADMTLAQLVRTREGVSANAPSPGAPSPGAPAAAGARLYDEAGTEVPNWHEVRGGNLLNGGTLTVTLGGAAAFTNTNYACSVTYVNVANVAAVSPLSVTKNSPTSFTIRGTGNNAVQYRCVGN